MENLIDQETKLSYKFRRLLDEYDLEIMFDVLEYEAAIPEFKEAIENFEDVHLQLKRGLGEDYLGQYPDYFERLKPMTQWVVNAKRNLRALKRDIERGKKESEEEDRKREVRLVEMESAQRDKELEFQVRRDRDKFRSQVKHLKVRIESDLTRIENHGSQFLEELNRDVGNVTLLLQDFSTLFADVEASFGADFENEFSDYYENEMGRLNRALNWLRDACHKARLRDNQAKEAEEKLRQLEIRRSEARVNADKITIFNGIHATLKEKMIVFEQKCSDDFTGDDSFILKMYKEMNTLDTDFKDILDSLTDLVKAIPPDYALADEILDEVRGEKDRLKKFYDSYKVTLVSEVKERDLTETKIQSMATLGLKLGKFSGYGSSMDYYTFRSDFEKLIVPRVQSKLLPDFIKLHHLEGQALSVVKEIDNLEGIWDRLRLSFGNVNLLLANKLKTVEDSEPLHKIKGDERLVKALSKLKNLMTQLGVLAEKHGIEPSLYHSSNLARIYLLIGKKRQSDILKKVLDRDFSEKETWNEIVTYLDKELRLKEHMLLVTPCQNTQSEGAQRRRADDSYHVDTSNEARKCVICDKIDHEPTVTSRGNKVINYFSCEKFANMTAKKRFDILKSKHLCFQCLTPGFKSGHQGDCFDKFKCPHESHNTHNRGLHVLICNQHKENRENIELLEEYKAKYITFSGSPHQEFSRNIRVHHVESHAAEATDEAKEMAMYLLQPIQIEGEMFNLFYDNGCSDALCTKNAVDRLLRLGKANLFKKGPFPLVGVNEKKSMSEHGKYKVTLPLHDCKPAEIIGLCLDKITSTFPIYPLPEVEKDIRAAYKESGRNPKRLPKLATEVGGETHIMIGTLYNKYFPKELFRLPNGLSIYRSFFKNPDGSRGIVSGPHRIVSEVHKAFGSNFVMTRSYLTAAAKSYFEGYRMDIDVSFLHPKQENIWVQMTRYLLIPMTFRWNTAAHIVCTFLIVCRQGNDHLRI